MLVVRRRGLPAQCSRLRLTRPRILENRDREERTSRSNHLNHLSTEQLVLAVSPLDTVPLLVSVSHLYLVPALVVAVQRNTPSRRSLSVTVAISLEFTPMPLAARTLSRSSLAKFPRVIVSLPTIAAAARHPPSRSGPQVTTIVVATIFRAHAIVSPPFANYRLASEVQHTREN